MWSGWQLTETDDTKMYNICDRFNCKIVCLILFALILTEVVIWTLISSDVGIICVKLDRYMTEGAHTFSGHLFLIEMAVSCLCKQIGAARYNRFMVYMFIIIFI